MNLEIDLRRLGVLEKALQIARELGPAAAERYVLSAYRLLSKVYHPDLHAPGKEAAEAGQRELNAIKERLDRLGPGELARWLAGRCQPGQDACHHPKVLVVEDEDGLQKNLRGLLELEGYRVASAGDGARGLREHLLFRPELVITDVVMPVMDGVEMVRILRERDPWLKAIFISGFFGTRSVRGELLSEIERFGYPMLAKPFRPSVLLQAVRRVLEEP